MDTAILFRASLAEEEEMDIASRYFDIFGRRGQAPPNTLIIGRYSVLPYYRELVDDLMDKGSKLINSYKFHKWVASFDYYSLISDLTPETWDEDSFYTCPIEGPFIVKGETNSRKLEWDKLMFAKTKRDALLIASELRKDGLICSQKIFFRKYIPLVTFEVGLNGLPFTHEYRLFFLNDTYLAGGYYWTNMTDAEHMNVVPPEAITLGREVANRVVDAGHRGFYVVDVAEKLSGGWTVIELNDGQQSGLTGVDADRLYSNLYKALQLL